MEISCRTDRFSDIDRHIENLAPIYGYLDAPLLPLEKALERVIHLMPTLDRFIVISKRRCHYPSEHGLTHDESAAIFLYSMDWGPQSFYRLLNRLLRDENRDTLTPWFAYLKLFHLALEKLPSFNGNVWRGIKIDISMEFIVNQELTWWSGCFITFTIDNKCLSFTPNWLPQVNPKLKSLFGDIDLVIY
ncbi:unnamed protein product [Rotaria sp. Silwood2]|nr:unnamed protein product [Rotaria sp. Silwood2]CAF4494912.1 unnamed protein product [Rotaria sp. Silwood2]